MSNPTQAQIRNLNTQESEQMRRYQRRCLRRIFKHRAEARNKYEQEQDIERKTKCQP